MKILKNIFQFAAICSLIIFLSWRFIISLRLVAYVLDHPVIPEEFEANFYSTVETIQMRGGYFDIDFEIIQMRGLMPYLNADILPIGEIVIPAIDLQLPILHFVLYENVHLGATTMSPADQMQPMGVGNYVLTSQPEFYSQTLFGNIHRLEVGDLIYMRDEGYVYIYEVTLANEIIGYYRVDVTDEVPNMILVTLLTTTPNGEGRIMVQGEFVDRILISDLISGSERVESELAIVIYRMTEGRSSISFPWLQIIGTIVVAILASLGRVIHASI